VCEWLSDKPFQGTRFPATQLHILLKRGERGKKEKLTVKTDWPSAGTACRLAQVSMLFEEGREGKEARHSKLATFAHSLRSTNPTSPLHSSPLFLEKRRKAARVPWL